MSESSPFYITTTLPYVNASPHMGHALEFVRADAVARYKQLMGFDVFFNTGTDEHGVKIYEKAQEAGVEPQAYVDRAAQTFKDLTGKLGMLESLHFTRTTDEHHVKAAQEFWRRCADDIYKGTYEVRYCVGCEMEKTESELNDNGRCPLHPDRELEIREEENYFFRFSSYSDKLLELYQENPDFVVPSARLEEIKRFVERGLEDFSISRLKEKMPWGVPVPDDPDHVMYVWFDALVNYISTLGWPESEDDQNGDYQRFWANGTPTQYAGKDNLRQQAAMWQAMLMSAGLPNSRQIIINGFITSGGQKMSKSTGNVVDPLEIIDRYGTDALRYYLLRELQPFEDGDFTHERFHETYTANLVNGLGNVASRIMKMAETHLESPVEVPENTIPDEWKDAFDSFQLQRVTDVVWEHITRLDEQITEEQPFKVIKNDPEKGKEIITGLAQDLYTIGRMLNPLLPETSRMIKETVKANKKPNPLFPRIEQ